MRQAGVKLGFGTDLLGATYVQQCREFTIRREVFTPLEILRQATSINAEMMMQQGQLGCIAPGAHADLLVVDGDPLEDIGLLAANGRNLRADRARRRDRQERARIERTADDARGRTGHRAVDAPRVVSRRGRR